MLAEIKKTSESVEEKVSSLVYGHEEASRLMFGAFLIGGHVLLEGPPGIAKTLLAKSFAYSLGLEFKRIQFTPDLMPSDITGVKIYEQKTAEFRFCPGPIFSDIVLADEINRTPPKTQAALLEAMEEGQATIDGEIHRLSEKFFVIATQNPIEHEGTFPLPEAQLDRFLFKIRLDYPSEEREVEMISNLSGRYLEKGDETSLLGVPLSGIAENLADYRRALRAVSLSDSIAHYIYKLADASRQHSAIELGASPRAALNLSLAARYNAVLSGRDYVIPDDVQEMAIPLLNHRLHLAPEAWDSQESVDSLIKIILEQTPVPS